jgi:hypothetical protein
MSAEQETLDAAKLECVEGESAEEHEAHREKLEAAYAAFAGRQESNPAEPGVTEIDAAVVVNSETEV